MQALAESGHVASVRDRLLCVEDLLQSGALEGQRMECASSEERVRAWRGAPLLLHAKVCVTEARVPARGVSFEHTACDCRRPKNVATSLEMSKASSEEAALSASANGEFRHMMDQQAGTLFACSIALHGPMTGT